MNLSLVFLLVLIRVTCLMMVAPILGHRTVPFKLRLILAVFVTIAVFPLVPKNGFDSPVSTMDVSIFDGDANSQDVNTVLRAAFEQLSPMILTEMTIGFALGLGVSILVLACRTVGAIISQMAGLQWPSQYEASTGESMSAVSQLFGLIAMAVFVMMNGPEMMIAAIIESYFQLPLGLKLESRQVIELTVEVLQQSLLLTLRGVGPAVAAMIISTLTIGFVSRTYPQLNLLSLSVGLNQIILLALMLFTVGGAIWIVMGDIPGLLQFIFAKLTEVQ